MSQAPEIDFEAILRGTETPEIDQALESRKKIKILIQSYYSNRLMSADEQIHWQDASRSHGSVGTSYISRGDGFSIGGNLYCFNGKEYLQSEQGIYDMKEGVFISDPLVKESIEKLEAMDKNIDQSRTWIAKQYSEGDLSLEKLLRAHLEFTAGKIAPFSYKGILFFQLGRNSTDEFYVGIRDGKTYHLSAGPGAAGAGEGCNTDDDTVIGNENYPHYAYRMTGLESNEGWGHVGHF